jgi:hypothetical protein
MRAQRSRTEAAPAECATLVQRLTSVAPTGLTAAYDVSTGHMAQTVRAVLTSDGVAVRAEGSNLRYAAIAALGLDRLPGAEQKAVLGGRTAAEVADDAAARALRGTDSGAIALAAWARAETSAVHDDELFVRMAQLLAQAAPLPTIDVAWMATAAVAAAPYGETAPVMEAAVRLLIDHQGADGIYPHALPGTNQPRWRAHVGSFADQIYPVQALARAATATGTSAWLAAANRTASTVCARQGPAGQWWWHYDARTGAVVERYPTYSVHQHAMAPMALLDLADAGGADHRDAVAHGLSWLETHPEVVDELVADRWGLIWRKVGRRERAKAGRALNAVTSAVHPALRAPGLDTVLPAVRIDHECRPYELGWLLYAWLPERTDDA